MVQESKQEHRKEFIILGACLIICSVLAALVGVSAARQYSASARKQNHRLALQNNRIIAQNAKIQKNANGLAKQERLTCLSNSTLLKLLVQAEARTETDLKVEKNPKIASVDRTGIKQLDGLIDAYTPATVFCANRNKRGQ